MDNKIYSFSTNDAIEHGVDAAIMLHNIRYWLDHARANGQMIQDGYYWMFMSASKMQTIMPFWTQEKIRRMLKALESKGVLITGEYNKSSWDRTKWYTMPEFAHSTKLPHRSGESDDSTFHKIATSHYSKKENSNNIYDAFNFFWLNMKLRKAAKPKAEAAFIKHAKKHSDPMSFAEMLVDDTKQRSELNQFGFDKLNPTTYLNQMRWEDDKPTDKTSEYGYVVESFNDAMRDTNVPAAESMTEKRVNAVKHLYATTQLKPETIKNYFEHVATSAAFAWERGETGNQAVDLSYFLTEQSYNKARER